MTQQEKEQRLKEIAWQFGENYHIGDAHLRYHVDKAFYQGAKSEAAREYRQSQQKQETPELSDIRKKFDSEFFEDFLHKCEDYDETKEFTKKLFNFFAQYIKGTESDAVEFTNFIRRGCWDYSINKPGMWHQSGENYKTGKELYDLFKSLPKAPKEVGGE